MIASGMNTEVARRQCQACYAADPLRKYYLMSDRPSGGAHELARGGFHALSRLDPALARLRAAIRTARTRLAVRARSQEASRS